MVATMPLLVLLATAFLALRRSAGQTDSVGLRMLYRFSEEAQEVWRGRPDTPNLFDKWVPPGTPDFYGLLHRRDQRRLAGAASSQDTLSFSSGNLTMDYGEDYGWLHYAVINIGTPNISFLVALDTGSDLLWVPCECKQCASNSASSQQLDMPLNVYNPAASKTSEHVTCADSLCDSSRKCESKSDDCLYDVRYVSANTQTSGVLIEDVIYLSSRRNHSSFVETRIVFGCGQIQSGNFLSSGARDGLLGLGLGAIALPNSLAKAGLVKNSFSMCFESDGSGRIFFGDKGSASQQTTPFLPLNGTHARYVVGLELILVGSSTIKQKGTEIIVDSGTSFTYLPKEEYLAVTTEFNVQVGQKRVFLSGVPWQFCYKPSDDVQAPAISMVFKGGGNFSVYSPFIGIYGENGTMDAFCLAVLESNIAILGQSFMTGYQLVFDREEMKLGWSPSDCYKMDEGIDIDAAAPKSSLATTETTPSNVAPFKEAPPPSQGVPRASGSGIQTSDSIAACHCKSHTLCTTLSTLFLNLVLWRHLKH